MIWDSLFLEKLEFELGVYSVSIRFKMMESGVELVFSGVYVPNLLEDVNLFFRELVVQDCQWVVNPVGNGLTEFLVQ